MRHFTLTETVTTTFYMAGQTVAFIDGVCHLVNPSPIQLSWLSEKIKQNMIVETTIVETTSDKKKTKPSKPAAKKKRG